MCPKVTKVTNPLFLVECFPYDPVNITAPATPSPIKQDGVAPLMTDPPPQLSTV